MRAAKTRGGSIAVSQGKDAHLDLLEFARGPALWASSAVCLVGIAWRLWGIFRRPVRPDWSEPRSTATTLGALRMIVRRMWHHETFRQRTFLTSFNAYAYHIGLAIVFFGFLPHIEFIRRLTGLSWPAVPGWAFVAAVGAVFVGLGWALIARLTNPVLKLLSNFDDYFSWVVTMLPMITGMAVINLSIDRAYPAQPLNPVPVAVHLLSLELLLVWLPFGKLSHAFLVFLSRGYTGAAFARKGAEL
jgi:nitrate reductase gamma subunit